jgi:hypothetical protein
MITEGTLEGEIAKRFPAKSLHALRDHLLRSNGAGNEREVKHVVAFVEDLITKAAYSVQDAVIVTVVQPIPAEETTLIGALGPTARKWWHYHQNEVLT